MNNVEEIAKNYISNLKAAADAISISEIQIITNVLLKAYKKNKTVYILGNGGSASTASHMACDFGKGTLKNVYNHKEKRFKVVSVTDNVATITAFSNDLSYDDVFVQQLHNILTPGDVVIGITGSGNSANVIKALLYAKSQQAITIGLLGFYTGGKTREFTDYAITIQSNNYGIVEDLHLTLNHLLTECLSFIKHNSENSNLSGKKKNH